MNDQNNAQGDRLSQNEYVALLYRLALEYAASISGRSMSEVSSNVNRVLMNMPSRERQRIAIESASDMEKVYKVYQACFEND